MSGPLDAQALRHWPLPCPDEDGDKETRGRVLVVAGSPQMPGAAVLAGVASLRAGAGKLVIATSASCALTVAAAVPEARVIGLSETRAGGLRGNDAVDEIAAKASAVLIGPGMQDKLATSDLVTRLLRQAPSGAVVLDALAMQRSCIENHSMTLMAVTPHAGEMASLMGLSKEKVLGAMGDLALDCARSLGVVVVAKGSVTHVAAADGRSWCHRGGSIGLATSGSGDVLAGIITGLAARGATLEQACGWGVTLHALAGEALALRSGPIGYLARHLSAEVPAIMASLGP